ncbi:MAG: tetratricopeptide repeat protein [Vicinamibacterales bacterium]
MRVRPPARRVRGARRPKGLLLSVIAMCAVASTAVAQTPAVDWRALLAHGDRTAIEQFAAANPSHPDALTALGLLAWSRGDEPAAMQHLKTAASRGSVDAALELGLIHLQHGKTGDAREAFGAVGGAFGPNDSGLSYARAARAVAAVGDPRQANALYRAAATRAPDSPLMYAWWGDLFLDRHENAEAARAYRDALERDPRWAPAHLGLARALDETEPAAAAAALAKALSIDPNLVDAHLLAVDRALDADRRADAAAALEKATAVAGARYDVQTRHAVMALLDNRTADFDARVAALVERRPASGEVFRIAAAAAARQYQFDRAVELGRKAVAAHEDDIRAWAELGLHLARAGDEKAAYDALSRAFRADPYDPVTYNLLNMLETLGTFASISHDVATIRLHPDEQALLEPYVREIVTSALDSFAERYGYRPPAPLHVQLFNQHDDFAVRTAGLPGVLTHALGVCFGRVVAMVSPKARKPGSYSWQETLWHELAHVVTLQLSNQRVPRWLTEGISVYEERRARAGWGRQGDLQFAQALATDEALKLTDLEGGFMRPNTIGLAYYEASLLVEHIEKHEGIDAIRRLLKAYGEGLSTDAAIERVLGMKLAALDTRFFADMRTEYAPLMSALSPAPPFTGAPPSPDTLAGLLMTGDALLADGNAEGARAAYERAAALVPRATGDMSPHMRLADVALKTGDRVRARAALGGALDADYANVEIARRLAALADEDGDAEAAHAAWTRIIEIDPFDPAAHAHAGRAAMRERKFDIAEREFRAAIAAGAVNLPDAHTDLGEALFELGKKDEARQHAVRALENAPTFERAQTLLLKAIGKMQ